MNYFFEAKSQAAKSGRGARLAQHHSTPLLLARSHGAKPSAPTHDGRGLFKDYGRRFHQILPREQSAKEIHSVFSSYLGSLRRFAVHCAMKNGCHTCANFANSISRRQLELYRGFRR